MADEMRLLVRPVRGAVVGGVAAAIAERFELNIILLRLVFLAAMNASEISIALYVLLWLSIPNLRGVVGLIQFRSVPGEPLQFSDRVARVMQTLGIKKGVTSAGATVPIGLSILLFAVCLEFTKLTPADPFRTAPFVGVIAGILARLSSAIFYGSCGLLLFFRTRVDTQEPRLLQNIKPRLQLDTSERRALFGLISGVGAELGIDAALLRPLAILANIFTLGGAGAVYLATALILRRKDKSSLPDDVWPAEDSEHEPFSLPRLV
jgi:phage shock protein PspC (stress-responsive transcriptional regulator)